MLKTIICDDEPPALELLADLLEQTSRVEIVGAYQSAEDAVSAINSGCIQLAFFDIEMPELNGVEAVSAITVDPKPLLVFATAHSEYAVEAFGIDAIDFVLKPFDEKRIAQSVKKAERMLGLIDRSMGVKGKNNAQIDSPTGSDVVKIRDGSSYYFISTKDIIWIEAAGDYSLIHSLGSELAVRQTISALEKDLKNFGFLRVHRSAIVAINHISSVKRLAKGEAHISMADNTIIKSSRSYRDQIEELTFI